MIGNWGIIDGQSGHFLKKHEYMAVFRGLTACLRPGDVPHVERPYGAGGSKRFTARGRRPPACPETDGVSA